MLCRVLSVKAKRFTRILAALLSIVILFGAIPLIRHGYQQYFSANYPLKYQTYVSSAAREFGVEQSLIYAIIHTESNFNERATSPADARGLMQLTADTFEWALRRAGEKGKYTADDLYDPAVNVRYGVYVIALLREQFEHDNTVLAAYNAGQGRVHEWLKNSAYSSDGTMLHTIPYPETDTYIRRVNDARTHYQQLYHIK